LYIILMSGEISLLIKNALLVVSSPPHPASPTLTLGYFFTSSSGASPRSIASSSSPSPYVSVVVIVAAAAAVVFCEWFPTS
jgi:hypothetical protein